MLNVAQIPITSPIALNSSMGTIMHGVLMECIGTDYASYLHSQNIRPYTQQIYFDKDAKVNIWRITTLNQQAYDNIILPLQELIKPTLKLHLKQKNIDICAQNLDIIKQSSYEKIANEHFMNQSICRKYQMHMLTPTNFKTNGQYMLYPQIEQILKSLFNRWNEHSGSFSLDDSETVRHLADHIHITGYNISSKRFPMESINIPAFAGSINLSIAGPEALARVANILLDYVDYSGIGIKTALGMGRCYCTMMKGNS